MAETLHVLVVDDEEGMRLGVQRALRQFSIRLPDLGGDFQFDVTTAETGEQAVEILDSKTGHIDIVLLDHKLPGISGLDVLEHLASNSHDVLTIMITAYATLDTAVIATKRGAYDFLAKPFTPEELRAAVRKAAKHVILQREARRLAEEKRQVRFQFITVVAHEMKAPLNAIEGYLNLMQSESLGKDLAAYRAMIDRCSVRVHGMRKLILDLLDMTRIEAGTRKREFERLDVAEAAREAIETARPEADARGITIDLQADPPVAMTADRSELSIIFNNLVSNAVKYNRDGGRVDVHVTADERMVTIRVTDTGIGMTPEETARLFSDFVRIKNPKTRNILGSGLGLSTLKKLVTLYGGQVSVSSQPDAGSTFTITLEREPAGGHEAAVALAGQPAGPQ